MVWYKYKLRATIHSQYRMSHLILGSYNTHDSNIQVDQRARNESKDSRTYWEFSIQKLLPQISKEIREHLVNSSWITVSSFWRKWSKIPYSFHTQANYRVKHVKWNYERTKVNKVECFYNLGLGKAFLRMARNPEPSREKSAVLTT